MTDPKTTATAKTKVLPGQKLTLYQQAIDRALVMITQKGYLK